ncbi:MAG: 3D domain-containing protein [Candidatus Wildermuthbacteria bacterium]|nr:3D domain-containing protein [Candidatus Wildermuthbacteria bacterium]
MNIKTQPILVGITAAVIAFAPVLSTQGIAAKEGETPTTDDPPSIMERAAVVSANSLLPIASPDKPPRAIRTIRVIVTAYSSTPEQTDDTPFITASGKHVRDGIIATNILPFGTKVRVPSLYGDKIFVVEDRMHPRKKQQIDIWFPERWQAVDFGIKNAQIEILES